MQRRPHLQRQLITRLDAGGRLEHGLAIEADQPLPQQLLQVAAGELRNQVCERLVESRGMLLCGHQHVAHFAAGFDQRIRLFGEQVVARFSGHPGRTAIAAVRQSGHHGDQRAGR